MLKDVWIRGARGGGGIEGGGKVSRFILLLESQTWWLPDRSGVFVFSFVLFFVLFVFRDKRGGTV